LDAEWLLQSISQTEPNNPTMVLLLAQVYENLNKTGEAVDILNSAVDYVCPHDANLCAQLYSQLGNLMHTNGAVLSAANVSHFHHLLICLFTFGVNLFLSHCFSGMLSLVRTCSKLISSDQNCWFPKNQHIYYIFIIGVILTVDGYREVFFHTFMQHA